ncbi:hypothetical protein L195_g048194, partial [Trifolium pratense]
GVVDIGWKENVNEVSLGGGPMCGEGKEDDER